MHKPKHDPRPIHNDKRLAFIACSIRSVLRYISCSTWRYRMYMTRLSKILPKFENRLKKQLSGEWVPPSLMYGLDEWPCKTAARLVQRNVVSYTKNTPIGSKNTFDMFTIQNFRRVSFGNIQFNTFSGIFHQFFPSFFNHSKIVCKENCFEPPKYHALHSYFRLRPVFCRVFSLFSLRRRSVVEFCSTKVEFILSKMFPTDIFMLCMFVFNLSFW